VQYVEGLRGEPAGRGMTQDCSLFQILTFFRLHAGTMPFPLHPWLQSSLTVTLDRICPGRSHDLQMRPPMPPQQET
jgi:hypothetical protein